MGTDLTWPSRVKRAYARAKKAAAYGFLALSVTLFYFRDALGEGAARLLPLTVGVFVVICFETLADLTDRISARPATEFRAMTEAVDRICRIIAVEKTRLDIQVVAASGYTTMLYILPRMLEVCNAESAHVRLYLVGRHGPLLEFLPDRWASETKAVVDRVASDCREAGVEVTILEYDYLPCVHGILINDAHLFLGYAGWGRKHAPPLLSAGDRPHRYYSKNDVGAKHFFFLFNDWCAHAPSRVVYDSEASA